MESELIRQVFTAVAVVVDVDLVQNGVVEGREIRPSSRRLERDVIRNHRDGIRTIRTDECIDVRVVCGRILADERGFAVARRSTCHHQKPDKQRDDTCKEKRLLHVIPPYGSAGAHTYTIRFALRVTNEFGCAGRDGAALLSQRQGGLLHYAGVIAIAQRGGGRPGRTPSRRLVSPSPRARQDGRPS